ncbi:unnamed protein product [Hyaloperonospora brassicae]|uniref:Uncharacterized protein n=1 Tax=Hyaloperonospora brassicae TaxID=162125 RepID=A0AAV0V316_HYABA|nr:unnamed protein product [Hyaloperonospora brassicae]
METTSSARDDDDENDDDVELWKAALGDDSFASEAALGYTSHPEVGAIDAQASELHAQQVGPRRARRGVKSTAVTSATAIATVSSIATVAGSAQRVKRKNFSKPLQLMCLERYAQYARDVGRLPDKHRTQQILQHSYVEFLKQGGAAEEPRLTHAEFLKLIRNRRREIHARAQRVPPLLNKPDEGTAKTKVVLTPAKQKLQEEHAKIREFIDVIDRAREQARLGSDPQQQQQQQRLRAQQFVVGHDTCAQQRQSLHLATGRDVTGSASMMESLPLLPVDPMEQVETILQIYQETRDVQREIMETLRKISCVMNQHESQGDVGEPPSASV